MVLVYILMFKLVYKQKYTYICINEPYLSTFLFFLKISCINIFFTNKVKNCVKWAIIYYYGLFLVCSNNTIH